jgi:uncharacterized membrane protein YraQ (UPF0718 family)
LSADRYRNRLGLVACQQARRQRKSPLETALGAIIVALVALVAVRMLPRVTGRTPTLRLRATQRVRTGLMTAFATLAALIVLPGLLPWLGRSVFGFCSVCAVGKPGVAGSSSLSELLRNFFLATWYYTATVLPIFVLACLLSGLLIARSDRFRFRGLLPSFGLAAALPVCSCGVIPIAKAMMDEGVTGERDGLIFLATAPLLSPIIVFLALTLLGWKYLVLRTVASLILAASVAAAVRPLLPRSGEPAAARQVRPADDEPAAARSRGSGGSVLLAGWGMLTGLVRYVMFGVVLGSLFAAAVPPNFLRAVLESNVLSMATVVVVGVPINMCAGEEILLTAPLAGMGLTMGHAVAFALAGTGVCVSSIPLLVRVLGRRSTLVMIGIYLVAPFLLGIIINAVPFLRSLAPAPF